MFNERKAAQMSSGLGMSSTQKLFSLMRGASTLLVLWPATPQAFLQPPNAAPDIENLRSDVEKIGGDFRYAIGKFNGQQKASKQVQTDAA